MGLTLQFNDEAQQELLNAIKYYEGKQSGLGRRFNEVVNQTIKNIIYFLFLKVFQSFTKTSTRRLLSIILIFSFMNMR